MSLPSENTIGGYSLVFLNTVDEIEKRKQLHVASLQGIIEWKEEGDQVEAIESVEEYYETLKDYIWEPNRANIENQEMREIEEADPFLQAGKRSLEKVVQQGMPSMPGEDDIMGSMIG